MLAESARLGMVVHHSGGPTPRPPRIWPPLLAESARLGMVVHHSGGPTPRPRPAGSAPGPPRIQPFMLAENGRPGMVVLSLQLRWFVAATSGEGLAHHPLVAVGVAEAACAVTVGLVGQRVDHLGAGRDGAVPGGI